MDTLLKEFLKFWQKHSEVWEERSNYTEAFPHLLLMAFLQRILNGGGHIDREYAAGRGRMDLAVQFNNQLFVIEIKIVHSYETPAEVKKEGLLQIKRYCDQTQPFAAYLLIFDRRDAAKQLPWKQRIKWIKKTKDNPAVLWC
jgi:hypothetical protein